MTTTPEAELRATMANAHKKELGFYVAPEAMPRWAVNAALAFASERPSLVDGEGRRALPVEAKHLPGCEHSRAPLWLCECPQPIFASRPSIERQDGLREALRLAEVALEGVDPPTMAGADIALRAARQALSETAPVVVEADEPPTLKDVERRMVKLMHDAPDGGLEISDWIAARMKAAADRAISPSPVSASVMGGEHEAARRYIRDWCPDIVRDYVAALSTPDSPVTEAGVPEGWVLARADDVRWALTWITGNGRDCEEFDRLVEAASPTIEGGEAK